MAAAMKQLPGAARRMPKGEKQNDLTRMYGGESYEANAFIVTPGISVLVLRDLKMTVDGVYGDNYQHQGYRQQ